MRKLYLITSFLLIGFSSNLFSQDSLVCIVNGEMIMVSQNNAGITSYMSVNSIPSGFSELRLTYHPDDICFYTVGNTSTYQTDELTRIDMNGNWQNLGTISVPGNTVYFMESVAYNPADHGLYATASLNGGSGDYWSETLLKIDINSMTGTVIGTFSHPGTVYEPEGDLIAFDPSGMLYYNDTEPGGPEFKYFFQQDISFTTAPVLLHEEYYTAGATNGLTFRDNKLFFIVDRDLRVYDMGTGIHTNLGTMFTPSSFGGMVPRGLTWIGRRGETEGVDEQRLSQMGIEAYPNPTSSDLTIKLSQDGLHTANFYSMDGQLIWTKYLYHSVNNIQLDQAKGIYLLEITKDDVKKTLRVVVQ